MYKVVCPTCNTTLKIGEKHLHQKVKCKCGSVLRLPSFAGDETHLNSPFIQFTCSSCNKHLKVKSTMAGRSAKCTCGQILKIPIPVGLVDDLPVASMIEESPIADPFDVPFPPPQNSFDDPLGLPPTQAADDLSMAPLPSTQINNPYASPKPRKRKSYSSGSKENPLMAPAIILLVVTGIWSILCLISVPGTIFKLIQMDTGTPEGIGEFIGTILGTLLMFICLGVITWGAICMLQLKRYRTAMMGSIVSLVPCLTPCIIGGIPFGIWAIVLLSRKDVKRRFKD